MKAKLFTATATAATAAAALALVCASAAASEVRLSLSSADDYHFVQIPSNMVASIEGRGMVSNETTGTVPLRYEDVAFLREAISERVLLSPTSTNAVTEAIRTDYRTGIAGINSLHAGFQFYAKPEAQAFTNGIAAYDPGGDINESNVWSTVFSTNFPSMFLTTNDIPQSAAKLDSGSPLRLAEVKDCYEYVGKATRLCLSDKTFISLDGKDLWHDIRDSRYSGLIQRYDALKGEWVYGTDSATNIVQTYTDEKIYWVKGVTLSATRKKSVGRSGGKVVTSVVPSSGTYSRTIYDTSNLYPTINLKTTFAELGGRTATSVTLFIVGSAMATSTTAGDLGDSSSSETRYFIARVDAQTVAPKAAYAIICRVDGEGFLDDIFDRAASLVYGEDGLPYKTADALLDAIQQPPDPTGADDSHVHVEYRRGFTFYVTLHGVYVLYNDMKFNARVLEDGE